MTKDEALKLAMDALTATMSTHGFRDAIDEAHDKAITAIKEVLEQPPEERNFCPRCGKRAGKNAWDVHTCSLPEPEPPPECQTEAEKKAFGVEDESRTGAT